MSDADRAWSVPHSGYVVVKLKVSSDARTVRIGRRVLGKHDLFGGMHAVHARDALDLVDAHLAKCGVPRAVLERIAEASAC